jgi:hypothetical protein
VALLLGIERSAAAKALPRLGCAPTWRSMGSVGSRGNQPTAQAKRTQSEFALRGRISGHRWRAPLLVLWITLGEFHEVAAARGYEGIRGSARYIRVNQVTNTNIGVSRFFASKAWFFGCISQTSRDAVRVLHQLDGVSSWLVH